MNVHCASCGADLDAHRNRALIFSLIPHIARKLTLFMAIFIDRGLKLLNAIWIRSPSPEYTTSGDYRSSAADGSALMCTPKVRLKDFRVCIQNME